MENGNVGDRFVEKIFTDSSNANDIDFKIKLASLTVSPSMHDDALQRIPVAKLSEKQMLHAIAQAKQVSTNGELVGNAVAELVERNQLNGKLLEEILQKTKSH